MYPEEAGGDVGAAGPVASIKSGISRNLEGLIPLILIILIAAVLGAKMGWWHIPIISDVFEREQIQMLVIGEPSPALLNILNQSRDLVYITIRDSHNLSVAPLERLGQYDIVLLDQHLLPKTEKAVSRELAEAMEDWVKRGGKLIVVMDSGIYRSGGAYGRQIATDVVGWQGVFKGGIIPVVCDEIRAEGGSGKTCQTLVTLTGHIWREDFDHPILAGIEKAPSDPAVPYYSFYTFDVKPVGNEIAFLKGISAAQEHVTGIVQTTGFKAGIGKVLYFNYDPAITPTIFQNTLEYLR